MTAELFKHAAGPKPHKRQDFGPPRTQAADPLIGEPEMHIRTCMHCGLQKITVISRTRGPRLYRWGEGIAFEDERDPDCKVVAIEGGKAA